MTSINVGMCFDRSFPPGEVTEFARRLEAGGVDQLWVIEDCFFSTGVSLAAAALTATERLTIGLGILPAVARNAAVTAMELATLSALGPGRLVAGIGHGVQDWMEQMGARAASPVTALDEVLVAVRRLLAGETVTSSGRHVTLNEVRLELPPAVVPPVVAGVRGPKSMAVAGRSADGVVTADGAVPAFVQQARSQAGRLQGDGWRVSVFSPLCIADDRNEAYGLMAPLLAEWLGWSPAIAAHPHVDEMRQRLDEGGEGALVSMPREWWLDIGATGTFDDAVEHVARLAEAGVDDIAIHPAPELDIAREQVDQVVRIAAASR
ncbi:MAG TPA: LLM class flavin-dependent oxidoreductase [Ilumatobacteraceae bacterium]|nr:LLM class flavin-dependent oxidoreductase [Ilumatobacteraceae bacterium]